MPQITEILYHSGTLLLLRYIPCLRLPAFSLTAAPFNHCGLYHASDYRHSLSQRHPFIIAVYNMFITGILSHSGTFYYCGLCHALDYQHSPITAATSYYCGLYHASDYQHSLSQRQLLLLWFMPCFRLPAFSITAATSYYCGLCHASDYQHSLSQRLPPIIVVYAMLQITSILSHSGNFYYCGLCHASDYQHSLSQRQPPIIVVYAMLQITSILSHSGNLLLLWYIPCLRLPAFSLTAAPFNHCGLYHASDYRHSLSQRHPFIIAVYNMFITGILSHSGTFYYCGLCHALDYQHSPITAATSYYCGLYHASDYQHSLSQRQLLLLWFMPCFRLPAFSITAATSYYCGLCHASDYQHSLSQRQPPIIVVYAMLQITSILSHSGNFYYCGLCHASDYQHSLSQRQPPIIVVYAMLQITSILSHSGNLLLLWFMPCFRLPAFSITLATSYYCGLCHASDYQHSLSQWQPPIIVVYTMPQITDILSLSGTPLLLRFITCLLQAFSLTAAPSIIVVYAML